MGTLCYKDSGPQGRTFGYDSRKRSGGPQAAIIIETCTYKRSCAP